MNDKVMQEAVKLLHELTANLHAMALPAWHIYLMVIQANGLVSLVEGIGWILALVLMSVFLWKVTAHGVREDWDMEGIIPLRMLTGTAVIASIVTFFGVFFDVWNWIAIFNPQLYAAHEIIQKVLGN